MTDYLISKYISVGIPLALICYGAFLWSGPPAAYWWFLVILTIILGYAHFFIGFLYHLKAIFRQARWRMQLGVFLSLSLVSVVICVFMITHEMYHYLSVGVVVYFVLHGMLNEKTLLKDQTGTEVPVSYFLLLTLPFLALILASVAHPSFFFNEEINFLPVSEVSIMLSIKNAFYVDPSLFAYTLLAVFFFLVFWILRGRDRATSLPAFLLFGGAAAALVFFLSPLNYVYFFLLYLGYHFIVWSVVYYQKLLRTVPHLVAPYIKQHILLLGVLIGILLLSRTGDAATLAGTLSGLVFNMGVFITCTFIHITTSLMNEPFVKRLLS